MDNKCTNSIHNVAFSLDNIVSGVLDIEFKYGIPNQIVQFSMTPSDAISIRKYSGFDTIGSE